MAETFSKRIERRRRLWWALPLPGGGRPVGDALHRLQERRAPRSRDDPEDVWRCCGSWPRTLVDKWNGREFALRHGAEVPLLYWHGAAHRVPASLPESYARRPVRGERRRGVLVVAGGRELLRGDPLREGRRARILIEEFVRAEDGTDRLPTELKCHTFGGHVAAVEVLERSGANAAGRRYYTPEWEPFADRMYTGKGIVPQAELRPPPRGLDAMLATSERLGAAIGTYMRIDFFAGERGCVFNEFSSMPLHGRRYTPYCNELFGALWEEHAATAS